MVTYLAVVNPDAIDTVDTDRISAPDVLGVQVLENKCQYVIFNQSRKKPTVMWMF